MTSTGLCMSALVCRTSNTVWRCPSSLSRTLYTPSAIGLDGYQRRRTQVQSQFSGLDDKFRAKMKEFALPDSKNMIFTEDLKNMLHLIEDKPDELSLISMMMRKFNEQNRNLRFGTFTFGPVIMRMYYHLNQPSEALAAFKDPQMEGMFDQLITAQILCDLLYNNHMYQDVLDVFEIMQHKKLQGFSYPRNIVMLAMASCYKMNTADSFNKAIEALNKMKESGVEITRRAVSFVAALALQQNAPQVTLELLGGVRGSNYVTIRNLKIQALADLQRPDDALPIVRLSLELDTPTSEVKHTVCPDVLDSLAAAVDRLGHKETSLEYQRIVKALQETNLIAESTLTTLLEAEIDLPKEDVRMNQRGFQRDAINSRMSGNSRGFGQQMDFKPRRNPAYNRERQSIKYEY